MTPVFFFTIFSSFIIAFFSGFFYKQVAFKLGIIDEPDDKRKIHTRPTPLLGGVSIYTALVICIFINYTHFSSLMPILLGATAMLFINLLDDMRGLSARLRVIVEIIVALLMISSGLKISFLPHGFLGNLGEVVITLIWIVGLTNAFNYLDGMDGLAAGSAVINLSFFAIILFMTGQADLGFFALILGAACLGFLPHNFAKEKMFLGDSGSTLLGFILACLSLVGTWAENNIVRISIPILIMGVPIFDMIFTTYMRIKDKKIKNVLEWLKYAGKDHFHHSLVYVGLIPRHAVIFIWAITFALGLSAVMVSNDAAWEGIVTLLQASIIFITIATLIIVGRHRKSGWGKEE
jgi:UDP-GlcNAc:undecaprenyl-phosphate GlcNAc-1-phosphate transferase